MPSLVKVGSFFISPDLISSQLLLEIVHCIPLSPQSVPSQLVSSHLMSCLLRFSHLISSHLISSHLISCLLSSSPPFPVDHNCPHLFSCHLSFSHLILAHLTSSLFNSSQLLHSMQLASTQFFSAPHRSSHVRYVRSSQLTPSHLISAFLRSSTLLSSCQLISYIFSAHLSSSQLLSALLTSAQLSSAHSQIISTLVRPKTCSKTRFRRQSTFEALVKEFQKENARCQNPRKIIKQLIVATLAQPFHQRFCHLYKEDCMDTLGIRMQLTWILQPQHGGLHGHARIHMDPSISASRIAPP